MTISSRCWGQGHLNNSNYELQHIQLYFKSLFVPLLSNLVQTGDWLVGYSNMSVLQQNARHPAVFHQCCFNVVLSKYFKLVVFSVTPTQILLCLPQVTSQLNHISNHFSCSLRVSKMTGESRQIVLGDRRAKKMLWKWWKINTWTCRNNSSMIWTKRTDSCDCTSC